MQVPRNVLQSRSCARWSWPTLVIEGEPKRGEKSATLILTEQHPKVGDRAVRILARYREHTSTRSLWCARRVEACRCFLKSLLAGEAENEENEENARRRRPATATAAEAKLLYLAPESKWNCSPARPATKSLGPARRRHPNAPFRRFRCLRVPPRG